MAHTGATMAKFMAAPRDGHLAALLRVFAYINNHRQSRLVLDPMERDWSDIEWTSGDWKEFYPDAAEPFPPNAPEPCGKAVQVNMICDAAHATDLKTRRSTTGIVIFVNGAPIRWYSKSRNTIEASTFGSEFVAMRIAAEMNDTLRYKLRMMGVPIEGPTNTFGDNESLVRNASKPESMLLKKHLSLIHI